jgi:hypothetical protein
MPVLGHPVEMLWLNLLMFVATEMTQYSVPLARMSLPSEEDPRVEATLAAMENRPSRQSARSSRGTPQCDRCRRFLARLGECPGCGYDPIGGYRR